MAGRTAGNGSPPVSFSPSAARRRLGEELKMIRERTGLKLADAARQIQRSAPTLSRLENGKAVPRVVDVKALLDHYAEVEPSSVDERTRVRVLDLADNGHEEEWFTSFRDVLSGDMTRDDVARLIAYEGDATEIRSFEPDLVPGLLQTREYAVAVIARYFPHRSDGERERLVDFRMARQRILRREDGRPLFHVVVGELVLRRTMVSPEVMRGQLRQLLDVSGDGAPNVELQVAPWDLDIPAAVGGSFVVMSFPAGEPDLVYLESREGAHYRQDEVARSRYSGYFADLTGAALSPVDSRRFIEDRLKTYA